MLGASLKLTARHPDGIANLIAVEVRLDIACGYDTVLLVYERSASKWRRVLRWQRGRYDTPGDAFGDFFTYAVLPSSGRTGAWRMVVAHGRPWCTSCFSAFDIDLLQPIYDGTEQRTIWHYEEGYSRFDSDPSIQAKRDGFELRLPVVPIDFNFYTRPGVFRFRVEGDRVERVQPVATNGRGFVDAWLKIDWKDAKKWSDAAGLVDLKTVHEKFAARYTDTKDSTTFTYGPVLACSDKQHFQVEIDADTGKATYYQIRQEQYGFTMLSASATPDARCGGHNLMAKQ